jgi:hypothetical protein
MNRNFFFPWMILVSLAASPALAQKVVIVGDCMSDTSPRTRHMRDGKVWPEMLNATFGLELKQESNLAVSGTSTARALDVAKASGPLGPEDMVISMVGSMDCLALFTEIWKEHGDPKLYAVLESKVDAKVQESIARLRDAAYAFHGKGARRFFIANLPDMSRIPGVKVHGEEACALAGKIVTSFNRQLKELVDFFRTPGNHTSDMKEMTLVCVNEALEKLEKEPGAIPEDGRFYDEVHPSSIVHEKVMALLVKEQKDYLK